MKFAFFTLGGSQLWEDVFFYQKWRIQKYFESQTCRLLDPWDIKRFEGSFEQCLKAFYKYIEIYEMPRQKGHMIIMIHGLFDSKNIFKPLWREALKHNFLAAAVNYPSSQKNIDAHAMQISSFLDNLIDVQEISFVTKGCGALVLRELLSKQNLKWMNKLKINRIVEIAPPNNGSRLFEQMHKVKLLNKIFGPMLKNATPAKALYIPDINPKYELGIVDCSSIWVNLIKLLPYDIAKKFYAENEALVKEKASILQINNWHFNPLKNKEVVDATINFLNTGSFSSKKIKKL